MSETARLGRIEDLNVAVAHWHINAWGGAEYLVTKLAEAVGTETVFTTGVPEPDDPNPYGDVAFYDVIQDQAYTPVKRLQQRADRVFEYALWEDVDWREYGDPDVLITSGATPRAVITPDDTLHINYCHSPPRWFYDLYHDRKDSLLGQLIRPLLRYLRLRDQSVDARVDHYFVNSPIISRRLWKFHKRDATVLSPPVELGTYINKADGEFYLHIGRLDKEKGVPAIIRAFRDSDRRLILAGGRGDIEKSIIEYIEASDTITYAGFVDEDRKRKLLAVCKAVVFNGIDEDFGIVPIEANASGKACLVPDSGFPSIYVEEGKNGYIHDRTSSGIRDCIKQFERSGLNADPHAYASSYSIETFEKKLSATIERWRRLFKQRNQHEQSYRNNGSVYERR